jgi:hypothetical protein
MGGFMSDEEKQIKQGEGRIIFSSEQYTPEGLVAQFANGFSIVNTGNEVFLSFFQPEIPAISGQGSGEKIQSAKNRCVARVVLTQAGVKALTELLNKNWQQASDNIDQTGSG